MPIHDQGYRRYGGERAPHGRRVVDHRAHAHAGAPVKFRSFVILLLVSWLPFLVRGVQIYLVVELSAGVDPGARRAQTFREFLDQQGLFVFFVTHRARAERSPTIAGRTRCSSICRSR